MQDDEGNDFNQQEQSDGEQVEKNVTNALNKQTSRPKQNKNALKKTTKQT